MEKVTIFLRLATILLAFGAGVIRGSNVFEILVPLEEVEDASSISRGVDPGPPPFREFARMSRYILHHSEWASMATISSREPTVSSPFANVFSLSDGSSLEKSSGIPYFYLSSMEISVHDLMNDNRASITMSLAQSHYCYEHDFDPEDPRCAHVIITGKLVKLTPGSEEEAFAKDALWTRHPVMSSWPENHGWFFAKLSVENILLLDFFGGAKTIDIEEYYKATPY